MTAVELMQKRMALNSQAERLSKVIVRLSSFTDFDEQLRRLHRLRKKLEDESYLLFCVGRAMQLSAEAFEETERAVCYSLEHELTNKNKGLSLTKIKTNPSYIHII